MLQALMTFAIRQRLFVLLATAALAVAGVRATLNLPIEAFPDVQDVQVQVVTQMRGQAPEEVERAVTLPIEREMSGVPRLAQLRSVSMTGLSIVTMTFSEGTDDYFARQQVLEKLGNVALPPGAQPQLGPLATAVGEIYRYIVDAPPGMPLDAQRTLQDWTIRPALRRVPGVADVIGFGGEIREYQVEINPEALRRYGVTLAQVAAAVERGGNNAGGGLLRAGDESTVIRGLGLYRDADDIGAVMVTASDGKTVLVSDVAEVRVGARPRQGIVAYASGEDVRDDVIEGVVVMTKGQNASKVVEALKAQVDAINEQMAFDAQATGRTPARITPIYERSALIRHTVDTVLHNLVVGAALVIAVLLVFLRNWRAALVVAAVIPLALLSAFILMDAKGVPANLISLGAVDFGIIVDSAVVLVEALMVRLATAELRDAPLADKLAALRETGVTLGHPILFSKAIIITAFLPIFTFQRVEGKIFTPVALTLSFALAAALLLTLTLVPTLLSFAIQRGDMAERHSAWMERLQRAYRRLLGWVTARPAVFAAMSAVTLAVSLAAAPLLGSEFLPKLDEGNIWLTISLPPSTAAEKTKEIERRVRAILLAAPEVRMVASHVGRPDDGTDPKGPNNLEILADLRPRGEWTQPSKQALVASLSARIREIPGVPTNFSQVIQDNVEEALSGVKGEISVKVYGPDLDVLEGKAAQVAQVLAGVRGAVDVAAIRIGGQTEINVRLDRARLARLGLSGDDAQDAIQVALAGQAVSTFYEADRRFDVTVRLAAPYRSSVSSIAGILIPLPAHGEGAGAARAFGAPAAGLGRAGAPLAPAVALGEVASIEVRQGASRIGRESGSRIVAVKANLSGRDQGSFVAEARKKVADAVKLPAGYRLTWGGQFENQQRAMKRLSVVVPTSLALIFALLFWTFRSVRRAGLVLAMVPFTMVGGIAGLALAGLHMSVSAAVGFIAVAGISVQNGVIMVERVAEHIAAGMPRRAAVIEGAVDRLRAILMTALMAGLGLLPAALSAGIGSETQRPFAIVIVGGIVSATVFTLTLLPLGLWAFDRRERALDVERPGETPDEIADGPDASAIPAGRA